MTHPSNQHAAANCWSLRRAWAALRDANTSDDGDAGTIRSWRPGTGGHGSGHGDPLAEAVVAGLTSSTRHARTVDTIRDNVDQARWLATSALRHTGMPVGPALAALTGVIDDLDPATAHEVARYLDRADTAARRALHLGDDHLPLPGNPRCPACGVRMLRARRSNPDTTAWPVICAAGCRCTGNTCGCGMPVKARNVDHIWQAAWARATLDLNTADMEEAGL
ncbi:hypothetical protein [Micromonospora carbonacea]|uniref:hypothetical protein n=1 Tax=Micromonospora carbonacea TaxID=47853 RepID=UPI003721B083